MTMPKGFRKVESAKASEAAVRAEVLDPEAFSGGHEAIYHGVRDMGKGYQAHIVENAKGASFAVWRCKALDEGLALAKPGSRVYLKYNGKGPHPTMEGESVHLWDVGVTDTVPDTLKRSNGSAAPKSFN